MWGSMILMWRLHWTRSSPSFPRHLHRHHSLAYVFVFSSQYMHIPLQPTFLYFLGYFYLLRCPSSSFIPNFTHYPLSMRNRARFATCRQHLTHQFISTCIVTRSFEINLSIRQPELAKAKSKRRAEKSNSQSIKKKKEDFILICAFWPGMFLSS